MLDFTISIKEATQKYKTFMFKNLDILVSLIPFIRAIRNIEKLIKKLNTIVFVYCLFKLKIDKTNL